MIAEVPEVGIWREGGAGGTMRCPTARLDLHKDATKKNVVSQLIHDDRMEWLVISPIIFRIYQTRRVYREIKD